MKTCDKCQKNEAQYDVSMGNYNPQNDEEWELCHDCLIKELQEPRLDIISVHNKNWDETSYIL